MKIKRVKNHEVDFFIARLFFTIATLLAAAYFLASSAHAQNFQAGSNISVRSWVVPANITPVVVKDSIGTLYGVEVSNNSATAAYLKLYNAGSGVTCGTGTPRARYLIPANGAVAYFVMNGDSYVEGITACVVTGIADDNSSAPAATTYTVNVHYK